MSLQLIELAMKAVYRYYFFEVASLLVIEKFIFFE